MTEADDGLHKLVIDCATGEAAYLPLDDEERADAEARAAAAGAPGVREG